MTPNATTTPATMTVEEAGHLLGISRRSAYRAVAAGHLPVIRLGRRILVPTHKLHALLGIVAAYRHPHRRRRRPDPCHHRDP